MHEIDRRMYEGMKKHLAFLKDTLGKVKEGENPNPHKQEEYKAYLENAIAKTSGFLKSMEDDYDI